MPHGSAFPRPAGNAKLPHNPAQGQFHYLVDYHYDRLLGNPALTFQDGALLKLDITLSSHLYFDMELEFGFNPQAGFFIIDRDTPRLERPTGIMNRLRNSAKASVQIMVEPP